MEAIIFSLLLTVWLKYRQQHSQIVGPSEIEAVYYSDDNKFKGNLVCAAEVALSCDQNVVKCFVPFGTKFVLYWWHEQTGFREDTSCSRRSIL